MPQYKVSDSTIKVTRPVYFTNSSPETLGYYDPLTCRFFLPNKTETLAYEPRTLIYNHIVDYAEIYVKLTEGCNFCCVGCATACDKIEPHKIKSLNYSELKVLLTSCYRSAYEKGIKTIKIKWAGGEPLLIKPYKLIQEIQVYLSELSKAFDISTVQVIITNGFFLTEDKFAFIKKLNMRLSISLWGTKKIQDTLRRSRNGLGSFDVVIKNIFLAYKEGIPLSVNHVISIENCAYLDEFIVTLWDINDIRFVGKHYDVLNCIPIFFTLFRTSLDERPTATDVSEMQAGIRRGFTIVYKLIKNGLAIPSILKFDTLNLSSVITSPCGKGLSYLAIGPEGAANCHEELFEQKDNNSFLHDRNIFDLVSGFSKSLGSSQIINNPLLDLHGGMGCPRQRNAGNEYIMQILSEITNDLLALEIIRLQNNNTD